MGHTSNIPTPQRDLAWGWGGGRFVTVQRPDPTRPPSVGLVRGSRPWVPSAGPVRGSRPRWRHAAYAKAGHPRGLAKEPGTTVAPPLRKRGKGGWPCHAVLPHASTRARPPARGAAGGPRETAAPPPLLRAPSLPVLEPVTRPAGSPPPRPRQANPTRVPTTAQGRAARNIRGSGGAGRGALAPPRGWGAGVPPPSPLPSPPLRAAAGDGAAALRRARAGRRGTGGGQRWTGHAATAVGSEELREAAVPPRSSLGPRRCAPERGCRQPQRKRRGPEAAAAAAAARSSFPRRRSEAPVPRRL